ncbi:MAG: MmgE/PrpD family protein [Betaproteobacteria bacterium]
MSSLTETLVDKILAVQFDQLPAAAIDMAKQVTLDGIAVMLAGATEPLGLGRIVTQYVKESGANPQASVVAGGFKTSMTNAAFANGTMAHALDFDNTWYPLNHPTSPTLPAVLAIAEHKACSGKHIIESLVAAFEVQARLRMAATGLETGSGFHKPGTTGQFGAVTAASRMLKLNRQQTLMAFGLAGSRAGSMSLNTGTMTKSSHSGHAARMGVECAQLAQMGWSAHADIFGPKGFFDTFLFGKAEPQRLVEHFGAPFRMVDPGVGFKKHPSNYFTHRPIDAALALKQNHPFTPEQIEHIHIRFPRFDYVNRPQPETGLDGKFSVQYTTVIALLDGEISVDSFNNERRFAPDVVSLLAKTKLEVDDTIPTDFDQMHCEVSLTLSDGRTITQRVKKLTGWVGLPLTREERMKKFHTCARRVLSQSEADTIITFIEDLEHHNDITELMRLVRQ